MRSLPYARLAFAATLAALGALLAPACDADDGPAAEDALDFPDAPTLPDGAPADTATGPTDATAPPADTATGPTDATAPPADTFTPPPPTCGACPLTCGACPLTCGPHARCEPVRGLGPRCLCDPGHQDNDRDGTCAPSCATAALTCASPQRCSDKSGTPTCVTAAKPPIYIAFHWHMHQPVYWPYEKISQTESTHQGEMGYSVYAIHHARAGNYTAWPKNAVASGASLPHLGAQVSLSGSLMENLDAMAAAGAGFQNWTAAWNEGRALSTSLGNPRLDLVAFGYHHPLMGLLDPLDLRLSLATHRVMADRHFPGARSQGLFPPECAFTERMIPSLVDEGLAWSIVDNIHFDRAHSAYPFTPSSNLPAPNRADQTNTAPVTWSTLRDLWAPGQVAVPWGYQPHWVEHRDPATCEISRVIAVPAARYEGNEDARGGFGALSYEQVLSQHEPFNTDPDHPMLVVLHHDGDNYGGGTDSYYHSNFQNFVAWLHANPTRFVATTIQDYLDQFPPSDNDVIHVEDGAWSGADNGDPEFAKWNGDPNASGYSPDRNSWAVITAIKNRVLTAEAIEPHTSVEAIVDGTGNDTARAWHYLLNGETSCYWYWDGTASWDGHPTRAANLAAPYADAVIARGQDTVPPTLYLPQREPYNPGLGTAPRQFSVWTFAYDVSGLADVTLHLRVDPDGQRSGANETYAGGTWTTLPMTAGDAGAQTSPAPLYRATAYSATVDPAPDTLIDYYVSATDSRGQVARSPLMHVWVGSAGTPAAGLWSPPAPTAADVVTVTWNAPAIVHWGVNGWTLPAQAYWPPGTTPWGDGKAVDTPLVGPDAQGKYTLALGPFSGPPVTRVDFILHNGAGQWFPGDQQIPISPAP